MVHTTTLTVAAAALLAALPVSAGLYSKSSPVIQIDAKNYDRLIAQSNYTSIVEFYAPWCGHCKNLQPAYEKAAKNLAGLAKVAAVDCDEDANKAFCGGFGVQGFPTLKIVKPGSKPGKPVVEDYQGPRTAKGIVDAVIDKIPNIVKKVDDKSLEAFLAEANETAKAILFTEKGTTSALIKSVAIEFKGSISVAQIRNTQKASVELFGITEFPTLLLLPGGKEAEGIVFDGELKKDAIVAFLSQAATPNPDPAPAKVKLPKPKDSKKASKAKEQFESASKSHASEEGTAAAASATEETLETEATESPSPEVEHEKPVVVEPEPAPPIALLPTEDILRAECLGPKTGTCILAVLPQNPPETAALAVSALSEIAHKAKLHRHHLFPFYVVPDANPGYALLTEKLGLGGETEIIAVNGRRGWWRKLPTLGDKVTGDDVTEDALRDWVESIKLGDIAKSKLPTGLIIEEPGEPVIEEPIVEEQIVEEQIVEEQIVEEQIVEEQIVEEPIVDEPIVQEEIVVEETIIEEPAAQEPFKADEPIVEEILVEQTEVEEETPITETVQGEATTVTAVVQEVKVEETVAAEPEPEKEKSHDEL